MTKRFGMACAAAVFIVLASYTYAFGLHFNRPVSSDPADWGSFGDYIGGVLNPLLSFASILLIIRTIQLQRDANFVLKEEIERSKRESKLRIIDTKLSSLLAAQDEQFSHFKLVFASTNGERSELKGVAAILELEELVYDLQESGITPNFELMFMHLDSNDSILTALRRFYVPLRVISKDLSDYNGFNRKIREEYIETLIGSTDFSLLRLIILSAEHLNSAPAKYIKDNIELKSVLTSLEFSKWPTEQKVES